MRWVWCGVICWGIYRSRGGVGKMDRSKCEKRCLFSCLHLDRISDFVFRRVFCDGLVIIASFSWRQRKHFLDVLM